QPHPFSLPAARPLPILPSFPTRRSSDLKRTGTPSCGAPGLDLAPDLFSLHAIISIARWAGSGKVPGSGSASFSRMAGSSSTRMRSEEHTSELQSRFDLVCRLLLEKKNKL